MPTAVWCLLIDHARKPLGGLFRVKLEEDIYGLQEAVKQNKPNDLAQVDPNKLVVLRRTDPAISLDEVKEEEEIEKQVEEWLSGPGTKPTKLKPHDATVDLKIGKKEVLLIQVSALGQSSQNPAGGLTAVPSTLFGLETYRNCYPRTSDGQFTEKTLQKNYIISDMSDSLPEHVIGYRARLAEKRPVAVTDRVSVEQLKTQLEITLGAQFAELYDVGRQSDDTGLLEHELSHMKITTLHSSVRRKGLGWKPNEAHASFFSHFASYCDSKPSLPDNVFEFGFGDDEWPFSIVIIYEPENVDVKYSPKSDFYLAVSGVPLIIAEVYSKTTEDDHIRMLVSGATLVRLVNQMQKELRKKPDFVLMAIHFPRSDPFFTRHLIYQDPDSLDKVQYSTEKFNNTSIDRARFLHDLYNHLPREKDEFDMLSKIGQRLKTLSSDAAGLPTRTKKNKEKRSRADNDNDEDKDRPPNKKIKGNVPLEADGYEHVRSLGVSRTPYVCVVRRLRDGALLVAKIDHDPNEKNILEFIHSQDDSSDRIIPLIGSIVSNIGPGVLLPLRQTVLALFRNPYEYSAWFVPFAVDLAEGVAFLHGLRIAHRDIKPDNLVYTSTKSLQLIDFELAIRVNGADDLVGEAVGTEEFMAPEMEDQHGKPLRHSPIKADRWSCGRTMMRLLSYSDREPEARFQALNDLARQLTSDHPSNRPDLTRFRQQFHYIKTNHDKGDDLSQKKPKVEEEANDNHQTQLSHLDTPFIAAH